MGPEARQKQSQGAAYAVTQDSTRQRRLIVNADDFGLSTSTNHAIEKAHREGILTTASLMVNEPGFAEAVDIARRNPRLGVGLHLTLLCGHAALPPQQLPGLVNATGVFNHGPAMTGLLLFFQRSLRSQLEAEIAAQFEKFKQTGLVLDHVNGHLHLHLHPTVFNILTANVRHWGIQRMRLTRDPLKLDLRLRSGNLLYRLSHALIFGLLSGSARQRLVNLQIRHTKHVFGLLQNAAVDESYVLDLLGVLPAGDSELYSHPSLDEFKHEFEALISSRARELIARRGIELIRYQDL